MSRIRHIIIMLAAGATVAALTAAGTPKRQSTFSRKLKPAATEVAATSRTDSITGAEAQAAVCITGFRKALRAHRESFFVTNLTADTITGLTLELDYTTPGGQQLHKRQRTLQCEVPPGECRNVTYGSWDSQQAFYHVDSPRPVRAKGSPFKVDITVLTVFRRK